MESLRLRTIKDLMPTKLPSLRKALAGPAIAALLMLPACATAEESQAQSPLASTPTPSAAYATPTPGVDMDTLIENLTKGNEKLKQENEELRQKKATAPTLPPKQEPTRAPSPFPTLKPTPSPTGIPTSTPPETPTTIPQELKFEIGNPEAINLSGITHYPDGHTSFIKNANGVKAWISAGREGFIIIGTSIDNLSPTATRVIGPSGQETFDRDYAAPGSVIPGKNPNELLMFYHGESHPSQTLTSPFDAGIGIAISNDGGTTWEKKGQILKGMGTKTKPDAPFGAGQPSAIIKDGYMFLYYVDWNHGQYADSIHLARAPIESNGMPGSWEKLNKGQFENKGPDGPSTPVVYPPSGEGYAALPGVSFNTYLNQFIMVLEARSGFFMSTSVDGINWSNPKILLSVKTANNNLQPGEASSSYPTLWSPSKNSDRETDQNMILFYSEGPWQGPHSMIKRQIKLSR